jgi:WhiB family redox-sensing transcriptional regulator
MTAPNFDVRNGACRDEDPELFFPVGTSGPALLQVTKAKAVCQRCSVASDCLAWALASCQDSGVWGGMGEDERRSLKSTAGSRDRARGGVAVNSQPSTGTRADRV